jgi:two-component system sensor histidine kinase GlrK
MSKLSFQQLLFIAFVMITVVLSATSVQALLTLEGLANQSRAAAVQAVQLTEESERLTERTIEMERSARQYLVLDDIMFRDRYTQEMQEARAALNNLSSGIAVLPPTLVAEWTAKSDAAWQSLKSDDPRSQVNEKILAMAFTLLPQLNDKLTLESKREIARRNDIFLNELGQQQRMLEILIVFAFAAAATVALGFGTWLSRSLARIESAIEYLGQNQLDQSIEVGGPVDIRRLGKQLNWLRQRLADLEADKARFLRHISHELKTPLAALCEGVASLEDEVAGKLTTDQRMVTGILRQNTISLQTQIEDLLRYNAATFGAQGLQRNMVDVERLVRQVIDDQRLQWQARKLRIEIRGKARAISVDSGKLAVVLANMLSNAMRFSEPGGTISFILGEQAKNLIIDCVDQGMGVALDDAARIFEPFFQGTRQPSGARKGNGIGLSIVREYVNAHGGSVRLMPPDVSPASGAHFRIELPYED